MVPQIHFYGGATESFVGQMFFYFDCFEEVGISSTRCDFFDNSTGYEFILMYWH